MCVCVCVCVWTCFCVIFIALHNICIFYCIDFLFSSIESFKTSAKKLQDAVDYVRSQNFNDTMK